MKWYIAIGAAPRAQIHDEGLDLHGDPFIITIIIIIFFSSLVG